MRHKGALALFISLMLLPSASVLWIGASQGEPLPGAERLAETSVRTTSIIDVPEWRIGDNWNYDGYLDVADFVAGSGVSSNVQTLGGTLEVTVVDIYLIDIENASTLVYEVESIGEYESDGSIDLDGTNGCLYVDMDTTEVIRASDLATHTQEATIDVYFDPICWSLLRQTIGILTVLNTYEPPLENYDFPISVGESWEMDYEQQLEFSGSSSYVPIPDDTSDSNTTSWEVVSQGSSGVSFPGCNPSYNITNYNSDGDETGYNWYCPAIRGEIKSSYVQSFGFIAVHELASYQQAQRSTMVSIDIEYPLAPVDIDISAWVNVTNQGQPVSNQSLQFRYEAEQIVQDFTTDENGSYHLIFNTGNSPDDTVGTGELGSHGLLAWIVNGTAEDVLGASSLIIDSDVHEIDLVTRSDAVTVQRHRGNGTLTLDPHVGFNAVIGDALTFSVPVLNRGLTSSPASSLRINAPDGSVVNGDVPPLASLEEARIEVNWTVPTSQSFGYVYIDFVVDPEEEISEDGNRSNNDGVFVLYIGALPLATLLISEESLTLDEVSLDGSGSHDPDGGALECEFRIERANGQTKTVLEDDCVYEWIWNNNGEFAVTLVVSDEENDHASTTSSVIIRNRPPEITLAADEEGVQVASTITFRITNRSDADTQTPSTPVDILWGSACNEGQV
ncbi:MAG TPA: CARDB domain-containing protein, partial [Candidatus Thalassarchaeaceae archaeon]|nr:CARDB domain-containing protein [Candidatus Thalassarchaeaceae archaeon]